LEIGVELSPQCSGYMERKRNLADGFKEVITERPEINMEH
jgi:hypothetical protein